MADAMVVLDAGPASIEFSLFTAKGDELDRAVTCPNGKVQSHVDSGVAIMA